MNSKKLLMLMEIAIFAALALVLDQISFKIWAQGGSISFVMLPIILMGLRWGVSAGLVAGLLVGLLQMMFGGYVVHWAQGLLDYGIAFSVVGIAAVVRKPILKYANDFDKKKMGILIIIGTTVGCFLRFVSHTAAGIIFFAEYAGDQNVWIYSIGYNASYMLPATILTAIVAILIFTSAPRLLKQ